MSELAENKRTRKYESAAKVKAWETRFKGLSKDVNEAEELGTQVADAVWLVACLAEWMRDMKAWGSDVRDDIIRLEAAVGLAPGEPGDPPPAPRE